MSRPRRPQGQVEDLPSGSKRVRIYVGMDPLRPGRRNYEDETVPPGPHQDRDVKRALNRLRSMVDERRNPRTRATVRQLFDQWLPTHDVDARTMRDYRAYLKNHIEPRLGDKQLAQVDTGLVERFYAELRRCRRHKDCDGRRLVDHRTDRPHECDEHAGAPCKPPRPETCRACRRRCRPHSCVPLTPSTTRKIAFVLGAAFDAAVRWEWIAINPVAAANKPGQPPPRPAPPSAHDAARLVNAAIEIDLGWAAAIWCKQTTGVRRGELCALRWSDIDFESEVLTVTRAIGIDGDGNWYEKDTKTHQHRRIVLDIDTIAVLRAHLERCADVAADLGIELPRTAFVFSPDPAGRSFLIPDTASQRFDHMAEALDIRSSIGKLRHYNATELLAAGVDLRTVAGRLGHSGGGVTTLRAYAAWVAEADQRAAQSIATRMPAAPAALTGPREIGGDADRHRSSSTPMMLASTDDPSEPYQVIARDLAGAIHAGILAPGDPVPTLKVLAQRYQVAESTAHRATTLLAEEGMITVSRGRRATVLTATRTTTGTTGDESE